MNVAIFGYGYIGKRLKSQLRNCSVVTFDKDPLAGADCDPDLFRNADYAFICLPTYAKRPHGGMDDSAIRATIDMIYSRSSAIVICCSTVSVAFSEMFQEVVYFPERVNPGGEGLKGAEHRVIGCDNLKVLMRAVSDLRELLDIELHIAKTAKAAVLSKLIENTYRFVNVALVNEFAITHGPEETVEAIDLASTKPFGYHPFYPSLGIGGHCIPEDPLFEMPHMDIIKSAELVRQAHAYQIWEIFSERFPRAKKVLIIGTAYKPNVSDTRNSSSLLLGQLMTEMGREVYYFGNDCFETLDDFDAIIIGVWHTVFNENGLRAHLTRPEIEGRVFDPFNLMRG